MALTAEALRPYLERLARERRTATYAEAARELAVEPPHTIHQVAGALEAAMDADAAAGRPLAAAVIVSRTRNGLPAPGFFERARALGRYDGPERGDEAAAFHAAELEAVFAGAGRGEGQEGADQ